MGIRVDGGGEFGQAVDVLGLALPDNHYPPAGGVKRLPLTGIASDVCGELGLPKFDTAFRGASERTSWIRMAMPDAAVDKQHDPTRGEYHIGARSLDPSLEAVSQTRGMEEYPDSELWFGVTRAHARLRNERSAAVRVSVMRARE